MKTFIGVLVLCVVIVLVSGYVENNYCHVWVTADFDSSEVRESASLFCKINAYPGLVGSVLWGLIDFK
jgi:hypothetical protein